MVRSMKVLNVQQSRNAHGVVICQRWQVQDAKTAMHYMVVTYPDSDIVTVYYGSTNRTVRFSSDTTAHLRNTLKTEGALRGIIVGKQAIQEKQ
jgi:hypothetical protein